MHNGLSRVRMRADLALKEPGGSVQLENGLNSYHLALPQ